MPTRLFGTDRVYGAIICLPACFVRTQRMVLSHAYPPVWYGQSFVSTDRAYRAITCLPSGTDIAYAIAYRALCPVLRSHIVYDVRY
eukprot:825386-Rhodomonas_salina.1